MKIKVKEKIIETALLLSSLVTILTTVAIIGVLIYQTGNFFKEVSFKNFFFDTEWTPLFSQKHYGILPLFAGTFLTTIIAVLFAVPLGLTIAIYLSQYAHKKVREIVKPALEVLAAVP